MAGLTHRARLDFSADEPDAARETIREVLSVDQGATRKVYAALAHKVWSLLIERRLDDEVRGWHALLQGVRTSVSLRDDAVAERMVALSDLLRESISLGESSPARKLAERPQAKRILNQLAKTDGFVARRKLLADLGIKSAHLSNILTQLLGHSLIVRRDVGKEAEFGLTQLGRSIVAPNEPEQGSVGLATRINALFARTETLAPITSDHLYTFAKLAPSPVVIGHQGRQDDERHQGNRLAWRAQLSAERRSVEIFDEAASTSTAITSLFTRAFHDRD